LALAKERGRRELRCDAVRTQEISPRVFRVSGCEIEATYVCGDAGDGFQCILESRGREPVQTPVTPVGDAAEI
jgi:hypothetical protein